MAARMLIASALACAGAVPMASEPNTFLKPIKTGGQQVGLIFVQGALVRASRYVTLMQAVQNASGLELWIGLPSFLADTPEPLRLEANVDDVLSQMKSAGFNSTTIFFGAHSLGTVFLQTFCAGRTTFPLCTGQILTGGFLARTNYYPSFKYAGPPTLTMGGSVDGLARVTRTVVESYYHQISIANQATKFPVVVIEGMNHNQWSSGAATGLVLQRDIQPQIPFEQAQSTGAALISDFMDNVLGLGTGSKVAAAVARTAEWIQPLLTAYLYEGSRHFNGPRQIGGPLASQCVKGGCPDGSDWTAVAQAVIAGDLEGWKFSSANKFVDCSSTPLTGEEFHLPVITNDTAAHSVASTTYSQCKWDTGDDQDTGFVYTSASEIGSKLSSRQCLLIEGVGETDANFSITDAPDFCMISNQKAYQWALDHADAVTKARYSKFGQPYTFGPDIAKAGGPLFLDAGITYQDNGDAGVEILAPMQKTEKDYWKDHFGPIPRPSAIPDPGCFHYCKLLSPARAMEWVYLDGLRRHLAINGTESSGFVSSAVREIVSAIQSMTH